jgi:hypothetical protein
MNENRVVSSERQSAFGLQEMLGIGASVFLVLVIVVTLLLMNWNTWGKPLAIVGTILIGIPVGWRVFKAVHLHSLHHLTVTQTHKHAQTQRLLAERALAMGHSVELKHTDHLGGIHEFRSVSPLTIPNAPVTIKELNWGTEQEQLPAPLPVAPPFSSIVSQIHPGHLFLGQATNGPIWGDITDLLSTLDVGRPGTGKSTLLRNVCGHVLLIGGKPIIFDPHGSILDDLGSSFECAESPRDIIDYSRSLDSYLTKRLQARRAGRTQFKPVLLLVDEMPIIASMAMEALPAIRRIVLEGRKVGMFALISGQGVPASILGGTLVRDAMASRYVFCTSPAQARMAGLENEIAKSMMAILEEAGPGKAVLATSNRKPEIVAIADTTTDDIRLLLSRNVSGNFRNQEEIRNISGDFRSDVKPDEMPAYNDMPEISEISIVDSVEHKIEVLPEIRNQIIQLRKRGLKRTEIRDEMHFSGEQFRIIKQVLDEEGL